jgi:hypothetical protein
VRTGCWGEYWIWEGWRDRGWRKLHNEELHNLYSSTNTIRLIKSKEDETDGACSTHGWDEKCVGLQHFGCKTWRVWDHLEDLGVDGRIILKINLR